MLIIEKLKNHLRDATIFNSEVQAAPFCILWPDKDRQWEAIIPRLQIELPELLILGDYNPEKRTGPAIWLRCVIAGKLADISLPEARPPIAYLPGFSRQDLRSVESCPDQLKPLVELQYRGVIWSQLNAKDWTILAYFKSGQGGLGLDVAQDNDAKNAMQLALYRLLDEEIELLKGKKLDKDYFNKLLSGGDPVRDLLQWLDQGDAFRKVRGEIEWRAFVEVCKSQLAFNPQKQGVLAGIAKLAAREGPWNPVWERFCEAPKKYPNITHRIKECEMPPLDLFSNAQTHGSWPQWNENAENSLRKDLKDLKALPPHEARKRILDAEKKHGGRRNLVWAELGESPLAVALEHLTNLSKTTSNPIAAGTFEDLTAAYYASGWRADEAVIKILASVDKPDDWEAVSSTIQAVYLPWAEESARYLQKIADQSGYPGGTITTAKAISYKDGECIFFVDGLRLDTAKSLNRLLAKKGCQIEERLTWAALPSVTATGKPAASPIRHKFFGHSANADFEPNVAESDSGKLLKGDYYLKKLLSDGGWQIIEKSENGKARGNAWCEFGNIDHEGHRRGWKLAKEIDMFLIEIRDRILGLLGSGWKSIRVVTDHGWLLLPGGLPKINLPALLTDNKWGRCAAIKPGASVKERQYPWFWNPTQSFAMADGISCFREGMQYAHGGLSLQECLTLELYVSPGVSADTSITITDLSWKGLRCIVAVEGNASDLSLDIRLQAGDPLSGVIDKIKPFQDNVAKAVVENEDLEGSTAFIVLIDSKGEPVKQLETVIGGGRNDRTGSY